jgi:GTPase SAR1 family protein
MASSIAKNEINIVLLGESGVGKSTWINAFANYLLYENLADAENKEINFLIPQTTTVEDENGREFKLSDVSPESQSHEQAGESVTRCPRTYELKYGSSVVRLIDTAGVNDTRGGTIDEQNIDDMLCHISQYRYINAICVLLKSQTNRINPSLRTGLRQIMQNLHTNAQKNLVFCVTFARSSDYEPGQVRGVLRRFVEAEKLALEVSDRLIFCFDSESVEYLLKRQFRADLCNDRKRRNALESWEESAKSAKEFLDYVQTLPPHKISETSLISYTKRVFGYLMDPLLAAARCCANGKQIKFISTAGSMTCLHRQCSKILDGEVVYEQVCHQPCSEYGADWTC